MGYSGRAINPQPSWAGRKGLGHHPHFPGGRQKPDKWGVTASVERHSCLYTPASLFMLLSLPRISFSFFFFGGGGMETRQLKTDLFLTWLPSSDVAFISLACPLPAHATLCPLAKEAQPSRPPTPHPTAQRPTQESCKRPQAPSCSLLFCSPCRNMDIRGSLQLDGGGPRRAGGSF